MAESLKNELVLVLGGARSGKSSWAQHYVESRYAPRLFLATAEVLDEEMAERVRRHRQARGREWRLVEEPLDVAGVLESGCDGAAAVLVDCLTIWLSNVLLKQGEGRVDDYVRGLLDAFSGRKHAVIAVANEVGTGIVPEHALGRKFRDLAGLLNQKVARMADTVVYMVAGLPVYLKGAAVSSRR
ncbi:MAG: bifunctional adenosylcobinamide kinase/adenosylcobinamide-phosphate guanylyltransferase [Deltaproteobacteria bacterium]|nr:MAG: bifunctional adenosylcobinamide kinase/adenosylcobinamide-phosphate guanylyltransferase [Deltaproteobacteria bacterium]